MNIHSETPQPSDIAAPRKFLDQVRFAMSSGVKDVARAAKSVGLSRDGYNLARKLLLLKARRIITIQEEETIDRALETLGKQEHGSLKQAQAIAHAILARYWVNSTHSGEYVDVKLSRDATKRQKRFAKTLFAIREACSNNEELEVPISMTREERREFCEMLLDSMGALCQLFNKVRGEFDDD